jgi:cytoplasmic iron level regulating protein YaaA (DUF328/UPF0246 family)
VLVLLPPSEGKTAPRRGRPLAIDELAAPALTAHRERVLDALLVLCGNDVDVAARVLGLGPTQGADVARNRELRVAPAAPARQVYTGVLYDALGLPTLSGVAARRATSWVRVCSALFGLVRPGDRIPAYRLAGGVDLPGLGPVARSWRGPLASVVAAEAGGGLVLDLRSGAYAPMWSPPPALRPRTVAVRVVRHGAAGAVAVSHDNKATKGLLVRSLLLDGGSPSRPADLADQLAAIGWRVSPGPTPHVLDVAAVEPGQAAPGVSAAAVSGTPEP